MREASEKVIESYDDDFDPVIEFETEENSSTGTLDINEGICDEHENNIEALNVSQDVAKIRKIVRLIKKLPLINRISQRRSKTLVGLFQYLSARLTNFTKKIILSRICEGSVVKAF